MSPSRLCAKALRWRACAPLATVLLATVVSAQTLPVPTLPPQPPPDTDTGQEPAPSEGSGPDLSRDRWLYGLAVGVTWDSNVNFRGVGGPSSWAITPRGRLARVFTFPRGSLTMGGTASWRRYPELEAFNRYNAGLQLSAGYRPSIGTSWQGGGSYELNYTDSSEVLSEQGVLLPLVRTRTATAHLGFSRRLGKRSSWSLQGRFNHVDFDEQDAGARGLADGQSLRGTAAVQRELGRGDSASIQYSLGANLSRQVDDGGVYHLTHFGSLQWNHVLTRRSAFVLEGGASYTPEAEEARLERRVSFYGGASYTLRFRGSDLLLFARREVTPAFGLGVDRVQTRFGIATGLELGRAWSVNIRGTHSVSETPEENVVAYGTSDEVTASLSRRLGRRFAVSAEGRYRRRGATGVLPAVDAYHAGLVLSMGSR